jgi:hypothetical protein
MLKKIVSIILLFALMITITASYWVFIGFSLNQRYISTVICENKSRPEMHCNGKCYLMKKLKQAEENENRGGSNKISKVLELESVIPAKLIQSDNILFESIKRTVNTFYISSYDKEFIVSFFHPPRLS